MRECLTCKSLFEPNKHNQRYCASACYELGRKRTTYVHCCAGCGKEFSNRVKGAKFCSQRCSGLAAHQAERRRKCVVCSKEFEGRVAHCSRACLNFSRKFPGQKAWMSCRRCNIKKGATATDTDWQFYRSWKETYYLLSSPANAEHLRQSIAQLRAGKYEAHELLWWPGQEK